LETKSKNKTNADLAGVKGDEARRQYQTGTNWNKRGGMGETRK
jgi:hypothetical protein